MTAGIYAADPESRPDSEFTPGALRHLVVGNRGRLLDARRTPVTITAVRPERGAFELRIDAFEDSGAVWELWLGEIERFQFELGAAVASDEAVVGLRAAHCRFDRELVIDCDPAARARTLDSISALRARLELPRVDVAPRVAERTGSPELYAALDELMAGSGMQDLEHAFAAQFVSNPASGELVKGHAIVLAELGLCPYRGQVARDPELFAGPWSKERRAAHLVTRLAFVQAMLGEARVTLFRGAAVDGALPPRSGSSFVSATFSGEVAFEHFAGGPTTRTAVLWRQVVPVTRVLMTFLETQEMNQSFLEAEAVLIGQPGNRAF